MTSKADRKRRKIAQRKAPPYLPPFAVGQAARAAAAAKRRERELERRREEGDHYFSRTPKQERAEEWFEGLVHAAAPEARELIRKIRAELTMEEFAVLAESARSDRVPMRIGHSPTTTHDLRMSALRKLVIYRAMTGLDERECVDQPPLPAAEDQS
ncbi:hypothetical protein [Caulobacter sp. 602-1]|uniref:hypothetical protein n=1 Tax=Caulobacter sp. 602-1 TaxID=2492472 RepID=UPI000F62F56B|nr:hypothetical protein [Caulobacter sp. 602-1]RRN64660.1 hypothetical protein EIK80_11535 [Caulobacter sp. 602-1]